METVAEGPAAGIAAPAEWYRALRIGERIVQRTATPDADQRARAEQPMERWRAQPPFTGDDARLAAWLSRHQLTSDALLYLLGESPDDLCRRTAVPPRWLDTLARTYREHEERTASSTSPAPSILAAFGPVLRPAVSVLHERLAALTRTGDTLPFTPSGVMPLLLANLSSRIAPVISRTLALELNVARLQDRLRGDTPDQRFADFLRQLEDGGVWTLLAEYPVLARQLVVQSNHWAEVSAELLERLAHDWPEIRATFARHHAPGQLVALEGGGDTHRQGRSVLILRFSGGLRIVYKPRSLAIEADFQDLLAWVNSQGDIPPFRLTRVLDRQAYGWVEFVEAAECASTDEVHRFYQRQGAYLALLYLLQATDFHYENLIAAGEEPVLIDLEALFRPMLFAGDGSDDPALDKLGDSVLLSGLLPQRVFGGTDGAGVDLSGLNGQAGQLTNHRALQWRGLGTDQMRAVRERVAIPGRHNRPRLHGQEIDLLEYADDVIDGFERMYRLLLRERDALRREWLPRFAGDEIRLIVRPTNAYARLLQDAAHPDLLRDALERDRFMSLLWLAAERQPSLERLVPSEIADLWNGDVPMFTTRAGARDVFDSGGTCVPGLLAESGLQRVETRLARMSETDLAQQSWIVRASLASVPLGDDHRYWRPSLPASSAGDAGAGRLLRAARAAGDRLVQLAIPGREGTGWLCLAHATDRDWRVTSAGVDLYDGLPGIVLALAYLGSVTGDPHYADLARSALPTLRRKIAAAHDFTRVGAFNGWGSLVYLHAHLYSLWGDDALLADARQAAARIAGLVEHDEVLDVVGGAAGAVLALLALHSVTGSPSTLEIARRCGDRLVARTPADDDLAAWASARAGRPHLAGFSHGAAGIASSLSALAAATGSRTYDSASRSWIAHERRLFCAEHQNWPDLREAAAGDHPCHRATWCHGAAGIGLARLAGLAHADDPTARAEIDIAARTTIDRGFGLNHSLCHGDLGNLDLLLTLAHVDDGEERKQMLRERTARTLDSLEGGYAAGTPLGVDTPGLMTGLAGIAYQLLRLATPEQVPSVLVLGAPVRTRPSLD